MKYTPRYTLTIPPLEELAHLVRITAGLLASGQCISNAGHSSGDNGADDELPVARAIASELLEQLRRDVERRVDEFPQRYSLTNQPPTE